jgi:glycine oxidase
MKTKKALVIGGGLSGISVAIHLQQEDIHVTLVDDGNNHSSGVAAGIINPLVFRRMTKSWRVDEFIPYGMTFYRNLENASSQTFYKPITIRRFFSSIEERENWLKKQSSPEFNPYMEELTKEDLHFSQEKVTNEFGSGRVKQSAWLDTEVFLNSGIQVIRQKGKVLNESFDNAHYEPDHCTYKKETYDFVVFCQGYQNRLNPLFSYLPVNATKGELIEVEIPDFDTEESFNRKCFVLPVGNHTYKVGATYKWHNPDPVPDSSAIDELKEKMGNLIYFDFNVLSLKGGVRPTTPDRRPIVGEHPAYKNNYIFNGLGTKGYMIAPLLAKEFCDAILNNIPVDKEIDLNRFNLSFV